MKKKLFLSAVLVMSAIVLVVATVFTTIAYLTSSAKVSNVFTVGNVKIEMYESYVDSNGKVDPIKTPVGSRKNADNNTYHLVPGKTYDKDPTVYVLPNCYENYLFVKIRNQISNIEAVDNNIQAQMIANGWQLLYKGTTGDIYAYNGVIAEADESKYVAESERYAVPIETSATEQAFDLFEEFTIKTDATETDLTKAGGAAITITAFAIQTDTFTDNASGLYGSKNDVVDAWNAIVSEYDYESETIDINSENFVEKTVVNP